MWEAELLVDIVDPRYMLLHWAVGMEIVCVCVCVCENLILEINFNN